MRDRDRDVSRASSFGRRHSQALRQRQNEAGDTIEQPKLGAALIASGSVLAAGGLLWHFLEPVEPRNVSTKTQRPIVAPWLAREAGGLAASGAF